MIDAPDTASFLIVEDEDAHAELIERCFIHGGKAGSFVRVSDGAEALDYVRATGAYADRKRPDVILLDLKLPKVDGHEVLRALKQDERFRTIPIIILTTSASAADKAAALHNHANSYVVKPLDFDRFRVLIQEVSVYWSVWNERND